MTGSIKDNLKPQTDVIVKAHLNGKLKSAEILLEEIEENNYTISDVKASLKTEIKIIKQMKKEQGIK